MSRSKKSRDINVDGEIWQWKVQDTSDEEWQHIGRHELVLYHRPTGIYRKLEFYPHDFPKGVQPHDVQRIIKNGCRF